MENKFIFEEQKARVGAGSAIYVFDTEYGKYKLLMPLAKSVVPKSSMGTTDVKVSCATSIGKINTVETLEEAESDFYMHRDSLRLLEKYNGKSLTLATVYGDYTAFKYDAMISYTPGEGEMDASSTGTVKLTPITKPTYVEDILPEIIPTIHFNAVEDDIILETTTGTRKVQVTLKEPGATVTAKSSDESIATVTWADDVATITGKKEGSCVIEYTGSKEGYASWETTSHVIVPAALGGK